MSISPALAHTLLNALDVGLIALDSSGCVLGWNPCAERFLQTTAFEPTHPVTAYFDFEDAAPVFLSRLRAGVGLSRIRVGDALKTVRMRLSMVSLCDGEVGPEPESKAAHLELRSEAPPGDRCVGRVHFVLLISEDAPGMESPNDGVALAFYSLLVHEVKNPLAAIKVLAQGAALELSTLPDSQKAQSILGGYLKRMYREIDRIVRLMDGVKHLSGLARHQPVCFTPAVLMERIVHEFVDGGSTKVELRMSPDVVHTRLLSVPDEFRQLMKNLFSLVLKNAESACSALHVELARCPSQPALVIAIASLPTDAEEVDAFCGGAAAPTHLEELRRGGLLHAVSYWLTMRQGGHLRIDRLPGGHLRVKVVIPTAQSADGGPGE